MSIETQLQIKHNAEEMRTFVKDVGNWADEMKQMDEQLRNLTDIEEEDEEDNESEEIVEQDGNVINKEKVANEYKEKGNELVKFGKWKEAIEFYDKAIELNENDAVYYGNRSYCYLQLNDLEQAEQDCTHALNINSKYDKVLLRRALIRIKKDQIKDAAIDLDNLLQIDPNNKIALKEFKSIYPKLKDLNYNIELKTKINDNNELEKLEEIKAFNKSSTNEIECKKNEMKSNNNDKADKCELVKVNAANEVKINSKDNNYNSVLLKLKNNLNNNNESYLEVKPYKSIPPHHRSKVPFKRIPIEDVFI